MKFEWDAGKGRSNRRKHGIDFPDTVGVFEDPFAVTLDDPDPGEERFVTVGMDFPQRLIVVCWTLRGKNIRIISARRARTRERRAYEEGI